MTTSGHVFLIVTQHSYGHSIAVPVCLTGTWYLTRVDCMRAFGTTICVSRDKEQIGLTAPFAVFDDVCFVARFVKPGDGTGLNSI